MKTIEIMTGGQKAQFTTKSVTFDGKEFFYANMSGVIHNTERHIYAFTYDGEIKTLPYEEKDAKVLEAIFTQVKKLAAQKKKAAVAAQLKESVQSGAPQKQPETSAPEPAAAKVPSVEAAPPAEKPEQNDSEKTEALPAETPTEQEPPQDEGSEKAEETESAEKAGKSSVKAIISASKQEEKEPIDPEKKARLKKSLIVFGIIVAAIVVLSLIHYFVFGTSNDPAPANPNATESQQYDDIDQLIDDLQ